MFTSSGASHFSTNVWAIVHVWHCASLDSRNKDGERGMQHATQAIEPYGRPLNHVAITLVIKAHAKRRQPQDTR